PRSAHALPCFVRVAVSRVHAVMIDRHGSDGYVLHDKIDFSRRGGHVVVMVVPHEDRDGALLARGDRTDVWLLTDAHVAHGFERKRTRAVNRHELAAHPPQHTKDVQYRLVDAVGRQIAESVEVRLAFELERR